MENQVQPDGTESAVTASGKYTVWWIPPSSRSSTCGRIYFRCHGIRDHHTSLLPVMPSTKDQDSHVGRAAGISAADQQEKISILVSPFYTEQSSIPPTTGVLPWVLYAALGGVIVFLLVLLAVLLIRGRISKRKAQPQPAAAAAEIPQPVQQQADIMGMQTERSMELRQDIRKFSERIRRSRRHGAQLAAEGEFESAIRQRQLPRRQQLRRRRLRRPAGSDPPAESRRHHRLPGTEKPPGSIQ
ncbi:MAG: hypothetical protein V8R55_14055 [Dysosmobacter sp.]